MADPLNELKGEPVFDDTSHSLSAESAPSAVRFPKLLKLTVARVASFVILPPLFGGRWADARPGSKGKTVLKIHRPCGRGGHNNIKLNPDFPPDGPLKFSISP